MPKKKKVDEDFGTICVCAVRYALGRCTYMPSLVQDFICRNMDDIHDSYLYVMKRDVKEAEKLGCGYGDPQIDKPGWMEFIERLDEELKNRGEI